MNDKLGVVAAMEPYVGRYFSSQYVRSKILGQTDSEILEIDKQIKKEIKDGIIPDPSLAMNPMMGMPNGQPSSNNFGNIPQEGGLTDAQTGVELGSQGEI
jgi:hypothetical protein